jgi:diguanylate cyclase (GGDEF)-like protein
MRSDQVQRVRRLAARTPGRFERVLWHGFGDADSALALIFVMGSSQGLVVMLMPHWHVDHPALVDTVALIALATAPAVWWCRSMLTDTRRHLIVLLGTVMTSIAVVGCGPNPETMSVEFCYALLTLYASAYFSPRGAVFQLVGVGVSYAAALAAVPSAAAPAQWLQAMLALSVFTVIVNGFATQVGATAEARGYEMTHDPLTGLGNRALFLRRIEAALSVAGEPDVALVCFNIDDFRSVNANWGDEIGDRFLVEIADRIVALTAADGIVARLAGDEFGVLIAGGELPVDAERLAHRIMAELARPFRSGDADVRLRAGFGIAVARRPATAPDLLRDADLAMSVAKDNGKGQVEVVRPGMPDASIDRFALVAEMRRAVDDDEFEAFYQPVVSLRSGRPIGAEALVRWRHPRRGLLQPNQFIPIAEREGLIAAIGRSMLHMACRQISSWRMTGIVDSEFVVSVNLSPRQLVDNDVVDDVADALRSAGLPASALVLEITESTVMDDFDAGSARLAALRDLGVKLALDDFGTGHSSLQRLSRLPIDIVKIDKSFVDELGIVPEAVVLVRSMVETAHALGMLALAEGVETRQQYELLQTVECDAAQGFLMARPEPVGAMALRLRDITQFSRSRHAHRVSS